MDMNDEMCLLIDKIAFRDNNRYAVVETYANSVRQTVLIFFIIMFVYQFAILISSFVIKILELVFATGGFLPNGSGDRSAL